MKLLLTLSLATLLSLLGNAQCAYNAGSDEARCFHEFPITLGIYADTFWSGDDITPEGVFTPSVPGTYILTLNTNSVACTDSDERIIEVLAPPSLNAGTDQVVCQDTDFQINAIASSANGAITVWSWSGGDQFLSSTNIPNPIASPTGTAAFNLTVVDEEGCFSFDQITVSEAALPIVEAGNDVNMCHSTESISLAGSPLGGTWSGPGVSGNEYLSPGVGTHTLQYVYTDALGCSNMDNMSITVSDLPIVNAGSNFSRCENEGLVSLTGQSPASGTWLGIGVNPANSEFDPSGLSGFVSVEYSIGTGTCEVSDERIIEVKDIPIVTALSDYEFCKNESNAFLDNVTPVGGHWQSGLVIDYTTGEVSTLTESINNQSTYDYEDPVTGCSNSVSIMVHIRELPEADFVTENRNCQGIEADIDNLSAVGLQYHWIVNGTEVSQDFSPVIVFDSNGIQNIQLEVENSYGCTDTSEMQDLEVISSPVSDFIVDVMEGCEPLEVNVTNSSLGAYATYDWDFEISTSSAEFPIAVNYGDIIEDTSYDITLNVENECGAHQSTISVMSKALPEANFYTELSSECSPVTTQFFNVSSSNSSSYMWDLGDGETTADEVPDLRVYTTEESSQIYSVELTASNECGSHAVMEPIAVQPNPVASSFSTSSLEECAPVSLEFTNSSIGATSITYDFGDLEVNAMNTDFSYLEAGEYEVKQYATDGCGFDTTSVSIIIHSEPVVSFSSSAPTLCSGESISFSIEGDQIVNPEWDMSDAGVFNEESPEVIFTTNGVKTISLSAFTLDNNCSVEIQNEVEVFPLPVIDYSLSSETGCAPFVLEINDDSDNSNFYNWNLSGITSTDLSPNFVLTTPGVFDLQLNVSNVYGCEAEASELDAFELFATPYADFDYSPDEGHVLTSPEVKFESRSEGASNYNWDFGDGTQSLEINPEHEYSTAGIFPVTLTVESTDGCSNYTTLGIHIKDEFSIFVPNSFTPNGDGLNDVFLPIVEGSNFSEYKFSVYNRWGEIVFQTEDTHEGWIGNVNNEEHYVLDGAYTWEVTVLLREGEGSEVHMGSIQVFR